MTRNYFLLVAAFISLFSFFSSSTSAELQRGQRPNVLFLMADDHRADVMGVAGDPLVVTPNLDQLAADGVRFTHFASQSPICIPTRASIMTGMYQTAHDIEPFGVMGTNTTYLAEVFADAGYTTGFAGKWHLNASPKDSTKEESWVMPGLRRGFQEWDAYDRLIDHNTPATFDETQEPPELVYINGYDWTPSYYSDVFLDFAERHVDDEEPWMYFLSYAMPHQPEEAPQEFLDMFPPEDFDLYGRAPDLNGNISEAREEEFRKTLQSYYAQVSFLDSEIGTVLEGLDTMGLDENTIVIYFSDHGQLLGSHYHQAIQAGYGFDNVFRSKSVPFANAFRAPLIIRWPEEIPSGLEIDALMTTVDLPTTALDLAGLMAPIKMQGKSMGAWCRGGVGPNVEGVYLSRLYSNGRGWEAVWTGDYVYCSTPDIEILYDHANDPDELDNLYDAPSHNFVRRHLQALVDELAKEVAVGTEGRDRCLVSTIATESELEGRLSGFRYFRDKWLLNNPLGSSIAADYYRLSPDSVAAITNQTVARFLFLRLLSVETYLSTESLFAFFVIMAAYLCTRVYRSLI